MEKFQITEISTFVQSQIADGKCILFEKLYDETNNELFHLRFLAMQGWFLRCSFRTKMNFLKLLACSITDLKTLIFILNTIYSAVCKDKIYVKTQGLNLFLSDKILNDDNRSLDRPTLRNVILTEIKWFRGLTNLEQYTLTTGLIKLGDGAIIDETFRNFLLILKKRLSLQQKKQLEAEKQVSDISPEQKKTGDDFSELEKCLNQNIAEDDFNDPIDVNVANLNQNWRAFITGYEKKLGIAAPVKKVESKKGKKGKEKKPKKEKISKDLPDQIQMLPIWINKGIVASIDPKELKDAKKVNKYWGFLMKSLNQDVKCRQELNKCFSKMKGKSHDEDMQKSSYAEEKKLHCVKSKNITSKSFHKNLKKKKLDRSFYSLFSDILHTNFEDLNKYSKELNSFPRYTE